MFDCRMQQLRVDGYPSFGENAGGLSDFPRRFFDHIGFDVAGKAKRREWQIIIFYRRPRRVAGASGCACFAIAYDN